MILRVFDNPVCRFNKQKSNAAGKNLPNPLKRINFRNTTTFSFMQIHLSPDKKTLGNFAGTMAANLLKDAIEKTGSANLILATGASQFDTLERLIHEPGIDWSKVVMFHLDEYLGLPETHPASFRKYLKERFISKIPSLKESYLIHADTDPVAECKRLNRIIEDHPIDVALVGIGENGHLAFNDPPADFETTDPYLIVTLDDACRKQQMGEGWFAKLEEVPMKAISMSIHQILKSRHIICSVPDQRKANAVKDCVEGEVSGLHPASILQTHPDCVVYLDRFSASGLSESTERQAIH
jgi:glucosamine-6-phosphate deaminase